MIKGSSDELINAYRELDFQNKEREKRAAELAIANIELEFQVGEKEKRAAELIVANKELLFQNGEKEKRAAELAIANIELEFQVGEKEKRAAELIIANKELLFQNEEKEKRAAELIIANRDLEQFAYIASHDLQEPLRTISNYMKVFDEDYVVSLDAKAHTYLSATNRAVARMSALVTALLDFSRLDRVKTRVHTDFSKLITEVTDDLGSLIKSTHTTFDISALPQLNIYAPEMRQLFQNLFSNAIKFQKPDANPHIRVGAEMVSGSWQFSVSDNGIGIVAEHYDRIFEVFRRLHSDKEYPGNGIGLANCKKIVQLHQGRIWVESQEGHGSTFFFTIQNQN